MTYTLITGASSGIGKEFALIAAQNGHNLVLVARNESALKKLAATMDGNNVEIVALDLSEETSAQKLVEILRKKKIHVDILINNAGFGDYGAFASSSLERQMNMIDLNVRTLTKLTHLLLPNMVKNDSGKILNVGSIASFIPGPLMSVYFASKAYVLSFSEALSEELRDTGVSVTCLCPGSTNTSFGSSANVSETHSTRTSRVTPRDVAEFGWKAMQSKKAVAVYGAGNRIMLFALKFTPRKLVRRLVHRIQK